MTVGPWTAHSRQSCGIVGRRRSGRGSRVAPVTAEITAMTELAYEGSIAPLTTTPVVGTPVREYAPTVDPGLEVDAGVRRTPVREIGLGRPSRIEACTGCHIRSCRMHTEPRTTTYTSALTCSRLEVRLTKRCRRRWDGDVS